MQTLSIFRDRYVNVLRASIAANMDKYTEPTSWAAQAGVSLSNSLETSVRLQTPLDLILPSENDLKDNENAVRLHKALPNLTPLQARDPRLWTRLTHVELWNYMRMRWPVEKHTTNVERAKRFVANRYFVTQSQSRAILRNGAARLWWTARLSYDETRDNPYELTMVLLSSLDITQQILERGLGRAPVVVMGFLEFLNRHRDLLLTGGETNRAIIRRLAKLLNFYGGVCILDSLSQGRILDLLERELTVLINTSPEVAAPSAP